MFCCVEVENPHPVIQLPGIQLQVIQEKIKSPSGISMLRHFSTLDISNSASSQLFSKSIRTSPTTRSLSILNHESSPTLSIDSNESSPTLLTRRISSSSIYSPTLSASTISNESSPSNSIDSNGSSPMSTWTFTRIKYHKFL